ncbi:hypothetical protein QBC35DRAFT_394308, partial [Podospora australis]
MWVSASDQLRLADTGNGDCTDHLGNGQVVDRGRTTPTRTPNFENCDLEVLDYGLKLSRSLTASSVLSSTSSCPSLISAYCPSLSSYSDCESPFSNDATSSAIPESNGAIVGSVQRPWSSVPPFESNSREGSQTPSAEQGTNPNDDGGDDDEPDDNGHASPKISIKEDKEGAKDDSFRIACPFRKRDPLKINIRSHPTCSLNFWTDISCLVQHLEEDHAPLPEPERGYLCPRCGEIFSTPDQRDDHWRQPVTCTLLSESQRSPRHLDPEDGVTAKVYDALCTRNTTDRIDNWYSLWIALFPKDNRDSIPSE